MINILGTLKSLAVGSGFARFIESPLTLVMVAIACVLLYLAIVKKFEPLLLLPIAFGMLCTNLLGAEMFHEELFAGGHANWSLFGGAVLINAKDLFSVDLFQVNSAGTVLRTVGESFQVFGHITGATGVTGNELVPLRQVMEFMAGNNAVTTIILKDAFLSGGQVFTAAGELVASTGSGVSPGLFDYL